MLNVQVVRYGGTDTPVLRSALVGDGEGDGLALGVAVAAPVETGVGVGPAEPVGVAVGDAVGVGVADSPGQAGLRFNGLLSKLRRNVNSNSVFCPLYGYSNCAVEELSVPSGTSVSAPLLEGLR
jgi:hypothetical protein